MLALSSALQLNFWAGEELGAWVVVLEGLSGEKTTTTKRWCRLRKGAGRFLQRTLVWGEQIRLQHHAA